MQEDWFRLVAPRPLLVVRGNADLPGDPGPFEATVRSTYAVLGAEQGFRLEVVRGGHGFFPGPTIAFLRAWVSAATAARPGK